MNRAQRRGSRGLVHVYSNGAMAAVSGQAAIAREYNVSGRLPGDRAFDDTVTRDDKGRFSVAASVAIEAPAPDAPMSRQQRRAVLRSQLKLARVAARAWDEVTGGDGVMLADGQPVPAKEAKEGA